MKTYYQYWSLNILLFFVQVGGLPNTVELADIKKLKKGFLLNGKNSDDYSGYSVGITDFNGDDIHDIIIGAYESNSAVGETYIIFGNQSLSNLSIDFNQMESTTGLTIYGINNDDHSGYSVSGIGDFNNDGYGDVLIGAPGAHVDGEHDAGETYVIFGASYSGNLNLNSLNGSNGFSIRGRNINDYSGYAVSGAGDFNGDGYDDVIIGAYQSDVGENNKAGESFIVFGGANVASSGSLYLSSLNGSNGFAIRGRNKNDYSGYAVSGAGDFNGDGYDDVIIGAYQSDVGENNKAGESFIVFGGADVASSGSLYLSCLNGSNGFAIRGINQNDYSGSAVSGAGDFNGDGYDDVIIGAYQSDVGENNKAGESFIVFGGADVASSGSLYLSSLNGSNGFAVRGINEDDCSGYAVSGAGDFNGDGYDDVIIGAYGANDKAGVSYAVFGFGTPGDGSFSLAEINATSGLVINGVDEDDLSGFAVSGGGDFNGDGVSDVVIGAYGLNSKTGGTYGVFGNMNLPLPSSTPPPTSLPIPLPTSLPSSTPPPTSLPIPLPTPLPSSTPPPTSLPIPLPTPLPSSTPLYAPLPTHTPSTSPLPVALPTPVPSSIHLNAPLPTSLPIPLPTVYSPQPTSTLPLVTPTIRSIPPTVLPTNSPTALDTCTILVSLVLSATTSPTQTDLATLKMAIAANLGLSVKLIRNFVVDYIEVTQRLRHVLALDSWEVSFDVVVSLGSDTNDTTNEEFQSTVENSLSDTSFQASVINSINSIVSFDTIDTTIVVASNDDDSRDNDTSFTLKMGSVNFILLLLIGSAIVISVAAAAYSKKNQHVVNNSTLLEMGIKSSYKEKIVDESEICKENLTRMSEDDKEKNPQERGGSHGRDRGIKVVVDDDDGDATSQLFSITQRSPSSIEDSFNKGQGVGRRFVLDNHNPQTISELRATLNSRTISQTHSVTDSIGSEQTRASFYKTIGMGTSLDDAVLQREASSRTMTILKSPSQTEFQLSIDESPERLVRSSMEILRTNSGYFECNDEVNTTTAGMRFDNYECWNETALKTIVDESYECDSNRTRATLGTSIGTPSLTTYSSSCSNFSSLTLSFDSGPDINDQGGSFDSTGMLCGEPSYSLSSMKQVYDI